MHITRHLTPVHIFTYGSLMFAPVWQRVVSGTYTSSTATLHDYQRLAVKGEEYPVALAATGHSIDGVLYYAVHAQDVAHLDAFEGDYYTRIAVQVITNDGEAITAQVYVLKAEFGHIAAAQAWDVTQFAQGGGLENFMARYQGFH
jgi:gamma-glutamylcyclotransferase (GGCT)/AIG2-like uncharacterized protein YtfP